MEIVLQISKCYIVAFYEVKHIHIINNFHLIPHLHINFPLHFIINTCRCNTKNKINNYVLSFKYTTITTEKFYCDSIGQPEKCLLNKSK